MDRASLRELFPVTRNLVYFNHAAEAPLSTRAAEAMQRHAIDQRDFGALHWRDWYAEYDLAKRAAARLIGADPDEIAILKNTTEGISFVAAGVRWQQGDNVVTTAVEFPSNWAPWKRLESRGVECRVAESPAVEHIAPLMNERTRVVTLSAVGFHDGFVADVAAIGALCAQRDVRFCVDGIQSVGVLPIDVRTAQIDFLAAGGHKWMCAPEGAAIFYVARERIDELEVIESGWTNIDRKGKFIGAPVDLLADSRRFEAGSLNTNGVYGLRAALDLIHEIGIDAISASALELARVLAESLESIGWHIASPRPIASPIIAATPPDVEKSLLWWHRKLEEEHIVCAVREGRIRFSPHYYNDVSEVERVVDVLRRLGG